MARTGVYNVGDAVVNRITLRKADGTEFPDITPYVQGITILQSIDCPSVRVILSIQDNVGLYTQLVGQEILDLDMDAFGGRMSWQTYLNEVRDLIDGEKVKKYNIVFNSRESYLNDNQRLLFAYKNTKISSIVSDILKKRLGTQKKVEIESTEHKGSFICPNYRPFDFISQLAAKAIRGGKAGQAGYLFYEALDGFHFKSMDKMCEGKSKYEFTLRPKNVAQVTGPDDQLAIRNYVIDSGLNVQDNLQKGAYGGIFYGVDFVNLKSENNIAKRWSINDNYGRMSHLGSTNPFSEFQQVEDQIGGVSRVFYACVAPHLFGDAITRQSDTTNNSGPIGGQTGVNLRTAQNISGGDYETSADAKPYTLSRFLSLDHISGRITVPGNFGVLAGDVITINVPRWDGKNTVVDKKNSGKYLVSGVTHRYGIKGSMETDIYIARDSYQ